MEATTTPRITPADAREAVRRWWTNSQAVLTEIALVARNVASELERRGSPVRNMMDAGEVAKFAGRLEDVTVILANAIPDSDMPLVDPLSWLDQYQIDEAMQDDEDEPAEPNSTPLDTPDPADTPPAADATPGLPAVDPVVKARWEKQQESAYAAADTDGTESLKMMCVVIEDLIGDIASFQGDHSESCPCPCCTLIVTRNFIYPNPFESVAGIRAVLASAHSILDEERPRTRKELDRDLIDSITLANPETVKGGV